MPSFFIREMQRAAVEALGSIPELCRPSHVNRRHVDDVLGQEPHLELVPTHDVADE